MGGEFIDGAFQLFLKKEGILMDKTAAYTPQQNPISERGNRTTTERARCMLIDANLPKKLWAEAVATAIYIENRSPEASIDFKTPHEFWYNTKPDLSHLKIFGCAAYKLTPKQFRGSKFAPTSTKQILLGYQERMHNYRLLNPVNGQVSYSHDVLFDENDFSHHLLQSNIHSHSPDLLSEDHKTPSDPEIPCTFEDITLDAQDEDESLTLSAQDTPHHEASPTPPASPLPAKNISSSIDT